MVVLDTTFLIHFLQNKPNAIAKAKTFSGEVSTTRINVFEILVGIYYKKSEDQNKALDIFYDFLGGLNIFELDARSAQEAAKISAKLKQSGKSINETDILIAAIALNNGEKTIVTQNVKDFSKIQGINVEVY